MIRAVITATFLVALSSCVWAQAGNSAATAQPLTLKDINGRTLRLSDYKGKLVLLNFWATWCAPCRAEMPDLIRWQRQYKSHGLQIIGITYPPERLAEVRRFAQRVKVNYPIALGKEETKEQFDQGDTLPMTVLIDRKGTVREVIQGVLFPEEFERKIKPLLR